MTREDLRQITMLGYLTDEMLDELIPNTDSLVFEEKEIIFRQGQEAQRFYMLYQGKVLLEQRISDKITVSVGTIKPGFSFGWTAMLDGERYTTDAICTEPCKVYSLRSKKLNALFENNHSLGFIMSQRLLRILKKRYDNRTEQFIKTIKHHPDISSLL
jgi:CRP/FNR family transcriptional regulator, cyclic AMP receptor protein